MTTRKLSEIAKTIRSKNAGVDKLRRYHSGLPGVSARQVDAGAQAALRRGFEPDVAAMAARHVAGDRQAEADAAGRRVARRIEADERPEHAIPIGRRDAGSVVVDQDVDPVGDDDRRSARHGCRGGAHWRSGCRGSGAAHSVGPASQIRAAGRPTAAFRRAASPRRHPRSAARYRSRPGLRCPRRGQNRDSRAPCAPSRRRPI